MTPTTTRYLEDLAVGERFVTGSATVTAEDILGFARCYDPQPMHLDATAAADTLFRGLVGSGWQALALTMRLMVLRRPFGATPIIGTGVDELRFRSALRPGDVLGVEAEVLACRHARRPGRGYVTLAVTTTRQPEREVVVSQVWTLLLPTRPAR